MAWDLTRSRDRIIRLMQSVPTAAVDVRRFDRAYFEDRLRSIQARGRRPWLDEAAIVSIPTRQAVLVDGVHVYVQLIDYHDRLQDGGCETEASHKRVLQFLHLHYSATDRIVEEFTAQRVDYHGPRLHAVVVTPVDDERERVVRAVAFAATLKRTIEGAGQAIGGSRLQTRVRIGIDSGMSVAVNSGRGSEPEPLFLGSPANHAAKLAEGDTPGIYLSDRVRVLLGEQAVGPFRERSTLLSEERLDQAYNATRGRGFDPDPSPGRAAVAAVIRSLLADVDLLAEIASEAIFRFHHHEPPLKTIDFGELMPSNSVRMPLASAFADLSGFTAYVDECIRIGRVAEMTANLHVIRGELAACARDDFGARKVRFIGDCLHALIAAGSRLETDKTATVEAAVRLAGGLRSSFDLCLRMLPGAASLGLAIGLELGETPVTRLGLRGDRSVRCASSKAVSASEALQADLSGFQTALGEVALASASPLVRQIFRYGPAEGLDDRTAETMLRRPPAAPALAGSSPRLEFRAHGND